ncbi:DAK2 domain-containing protein [Candidatus Phytoplasma meliae]|uniref:DAK2 domain-containing protein n=1 Tax=Candidatus Phytoplasma meliae TaxID=1848402 RepID=A0ABS5CYA6_9MOLU|nr:DAK2 domain-containing protein [Candidatus Phytoplasma meliae]MBP5835968.1 DAK2 domain-containing protein [Candidatus Phytoplasma meliae]
MKQKEMIKNIDGQLFKNMIINGAINLQNNYHQIDNLNVFPVPDRDTGTNMKITMMSGVKAIQNLTTDSIVEVSQTLSKALLMGAKGNSGVILSQFFAGMAATFIHLQKKTINLAEFVQSLENGYQKAYQAIIKPTEGTILTVFREATKETVKHANQFQTITDVIANFLANAQNTLTQTTDLLPVLKQAGVVDSGGAGFVEILKGVLRFLQEGKNIEMQDHTSSKHETAHHIKHLGQMDIKYTYCTEYIFKLKNSDQIDMEQLKSFFLKKGDSLVLVQDHEVLKIHIHTNKPGNILEKLLEYGDLQTSKIDNMKEQHHQVLHEKSNILNQTTPSESKNGILTQEQQENKYYLIAFVKNSKTKQLLEEFQVNQIIKQQDFSKTTLVNLVNQNKAPYIVVFPNSDDILATLTQDQIKTSKEQQQIIILPTKNIAQTHSVLLAFDQSLTWDQNYQNIKATLKNMKTGKIIAAGNMHKQTQINNQNQITNINEKDYVSIYENKVISTNPNKYEAISELLQKMITPDHTFLTIFYNTAITDPQELEKIKKYLNQTYDFIEVETIENDHDSDPYLVSLE